MQERIVQRRLVDVTVQGPPEIAGRTIPRDEFIEPEALMRERKASQNQSPGRNQPYRGKCFLVQDLCGHRCPSNVPMEYSIRGNVILSGRTLALDDLLSGSRL